MPETFKAFSPKLTIKRQQACGLNQHACCLFSVIFDVRALKVSGTGDSPIVLSPTPSPCMYNTDTDDVDVGVLPVHDDHLQPAVRRHLRSRDHHHPQHDPGEEKLCIFRCFESELFKMIRSR